MTIMELICLLVALSDKAELEEAAGEDTECVINILLDEDRPEEMAKIVEVVWRLYKPL